MKRTIITTNQPIIAPDINEFKAGCFFGIFFNPMLINPQNKTKFSSKGELSLRKVNLSYLRPFLIEPVLVGGWGSVKNALDLLTPFGYDEEKPESSKIAIHVRATERGRVNCPATLRGRLSCQRGRFPLLDYPLRSIPGLGSMRSKSFAQAGCCPPGVVSVPDTETMNAHFNCPLFAV